MKKIIKIFLTILSVTLFSCDSYLDRFPLGGPSSETYLTTEEELIETLSGAYSLNSNHLRDGMSMNLVLDGTTDIAFDRSTAGLQQLGNGSFAANSGIAADVWKNAYKVIGRCNFLLDNMHRAQDNVSPEKFKAIAAEARFIRAYTYQYLIEFYGDIPFVIKSINLDEALMPRTSKDVILNFVLTELDEIKDDFSVGYKNKGRATKAAALTIKARAALYNEKWEIAESAAKEVIDMGAYRLHDDFSELFTYAGENSPEIIWSHQYLKAAKKTTIIARNIMSRNSKGYSMKVPTQALVDSYMCTDGLAIDKSPLYDPKKPFENRDPRLSQTIALPGTIFYGYQFETHKDSTMCWNYNVTPAVRIKNEDVTNAYATFTGYCWRKYSDIADLNEPANSELDAIIIRYAEVLLIYAEAKIQQNEIDQSVYDAINEIRQRPSVNMPMVSTSLSKQDLLQLVYRERMYELAMEGFRLVDIRRWKIAEDVMTGPLYGRVQKGFLSSAPKINEYGVPDYSAVSNKGDMRIVEERVFDNTNGRNYLWPIPDEERTTNPNLTQNPGF